MGFDLRCTTSEVGPETAGVAFTSSGSVGLGIRGGMIGFRADMFAGASTIDDLVVRRWNADTSAYDIIDHIDRFTVDGSGYAAEDLEHDAAGNLTYDGVFAYTYDAWNRLVEVARAYRDGGSVQAGGVINEIRYDGRGRRIVKAVRNSADLDATYHYYYDGDSMIETRNGSGWAVKQHVWGVMYIDEIVQIGVLDWAVPPEPGQMTNWYWVLQDANYNVVGVLDWGGLLVERYEYSPYGERTVFRSAGAVVDVHWTPAGHTKYWPGADDPDLHAPTYVSRRVSAVDFGVQPFGICDIGHQGLMLDEETGLVYNRARYLHTIFGRFTSNDSLGYVDGMNLYQIGRSNPIRYSDPSGHLCLDLTIEFDQSPHILDKYIFLPFGTYHAKNVDDAIAKINREQRQGAPFFSPIKYDPDARCEDSG